MRAPKVCTNKRRTSHNQRSRKFRNEHPARRFRVAYLTARRLFGYDRTHAARFALAFLACQYGIKCMKAEN